MGDTVSDGDLLFCLFNGLTSEYGALKSVLQLKDGITFPDAVQHLKDQYELSHINNIGDDGSSSALYTNHKAGGSAKKHVSGNNRGDYKNQPYCSIHKITGHATKDCYKNKDNQKGKSGNSSDKPYCTLHKSHGHATQDCFIHNMTCYKCGSKGHIKSMCKKGQRDNDNDDEHGLEAVHDLSYSAHANDSNSCVGRNVCLMRGSVCNMRCCWYD